MTRIISLLAFALSLAGSTFAAESTELSRLQGKWEVKKKNDDGQSYSQIIEINKDKFIFRIVSSDQETVIHAEGVVTHEKLGPFNVLKFKNIKAGRSADQLEPVDDDHTVIYQRGYSTLSVAANFDRERNEPPVVDVYRKVNPAR